MISRNLTLGAAVLWLAAISPAAFAADAPATAAPAAAAPAAATVEVKAPHRESFSKYQVLLSNNIFVRDRARWAPKGPVNLGPPLTPEEATALRGIVRQGEGLTAEYFVFLEDVRSQETTKMRVGDPVCAGKLVNPTLDGVDYLKNGVAKRIEIGENLTGAEAAAPAAPEAGQPPEAGGPGGAPGAAERGGSPNAQAAVRGAGASPASTTSGLTPEQLADQMRKKRLKELGK